MNPNPNTNPIARPGKDESGGHVFLYVHKKQQFLEPESGGIYVCQGWPKRNVLQGPPPLILTLILASTRNLAIPLTLIAHNPNYHTQSLT